MPAAGAGAGAGAPPSQPQVGAAAAQVGAAAAQPVLQPQLDFDLQQPLLQANRRSKRQPLWHFDLQHFGADSHPHEGAAAAQVGAAAAQPVLQPLLQPELHFGLQQRLKLKSGSRQHFVLQQLGALLQPHEGAAAAHVGAAAAHVGSAAAAHVGSAAAAQVGAAAAQQVGAAAAVQQLFFVQQLDSQQLLTPSIRSKSSKPKLWVQRPKPKTTDPTKMFHFIEPVSFHNN